MLKKLTVVGDMVELQVSTLAESDMSTISLIKYEVDELRSKGGNEFHKEVESIEVWVDPKELREFADALQNILTFVEREGD